jgi:peptidoglycan/xylan/chitin deacetylase (PgdA/CDA1 family)
MGKMAPTGEMFVLDDLRALHGQGHELGCHTYDHCDAWLTPTQVFEESVLRNRNALATLSLGLEFRTLSYPISVPRPTTKRRVAQHFICCRGGGQSMNIGLADLNLLQAYFVDRDRTDLTRIKEVIMENQRRRGWLIFATHDVARSPSRFGCSADAFEAIVRLAIESGALVMPVGEAVRRMGTKRR